MNTLVKSKVCWVSIKALLFSCCILFLPLCLQAQQNKLVVGEPKPLIVKRGSPAIENLQVQVLSGFHVNSDHPKDEFLIPLKLTWQQGPLEAKAISFPQPEEVQVGEQSLRVFTGTFNIRTEFIAPKDAPVGSSVISGKIRYQACSNQMCFRPATIEFKLPVTIE